MRTHCSLCTLVVGVSSTTTPECAAVAYTSERLPIQLILNIVVLRMLRIQPKNDAFICIESHVGPLGLAWQIVNVILLTLTMRLTLNCPLKLKVVRKDNRKHITRERINKKNDFYF